MEEIQKLIDQISEKPTTREELKIILSLIDLTSLEGTDNDQSIELLCKKAIKFNTAAVCVYPNLVSIAVQQLKGSSIKIASVAGAFPSGQAPLNIRLAEAEYALNQGADEIDMVISRGRFLAGDYKFVSHEIEEFKKRCGNKILKVILETGELITTTNIQKASELAINAGANFIKTSTGKISINATLESACIMLLTIKSSGKKIGIKPSGGIKTADSAIKYHRLAKNILGEQTHDHNLFRFGASSLADVIFQQLEDNTTQ